MKNLFLVGFGGFAGSICRYLVSSYSIRFYTYGIPMGTLAVNLAGSLIISFLGGLLIKPSTHPYQLLLLTGFCGGFTTFSTFSLEGMKMLRAAEFVHYTAYAVLSIGGGLLCCLCGMWLAQKITG